VSGVIDTGTLEEPLVVETGPQLHLYDVLWSDAGTPSVYELSIGPGSTVTIGVDGGLTLSAGWILVRGHWPYIRSGRVSAGAMGSEMLVAAGVPREERVLVFFISGTRAWVNSDTAGETTWTDTDVYQEIDTNGLVTERRLSADPEARAFVDGILIEAAEEEAAAGP